MIRPWNPSPFWIYFQENIYVFGLPVDEATDAESDRGTLRALSDNLARGRDDLLRFSLRARRAWERSWTLWLLTFGSALRGGRHV
jgi:hypothetical protein